MVPLLEICFDVVNGILLYENIRTDLDYDDDNDDYYDYDDNELFLRYWWPTKGV